MQQWRRRYRRSSPENWPALQRRLAKNTSQLLLRDSRPQLAALARIGGWLAGGDSVSALLQRHQWRQQLAQWGLALG